MKAAFDPAASAHSTNTAVVPSLRHDYSPEQAAHWLQRHERYAARAREGGIDVLFIGDSLTEGWSAHGAAAWRQFFAPVRAANFGASGDRTQQVLWRLTHGELDGVTPKVVVLLIGTNNLDPGLGRERPTPANTPAEIVAGVVAILRLVQPHRASAKTLLLGLLPRGEKNSRYRAEIPEINRGLRALADGTRVTFLDLGHLFLSPGGEISTDLMPDRLHLSERGYLVFAAALHPVLDSLLRPAP
jgi:lysophospholipase L1-like esterase